ncbi:MAG: sulfurtransferase-like selenium metabolism protein YedF [Calditerrivibrio sp.]|nr:sulfurtransferase-like selenium metabolism protein YedF [Calditerrivibrio sp.]
MMVDARGKSCPTPVIMTKKKLEEIVEGTFTVIVDNEVSKTNVVKFLQSQGIYHEVENKDGYFYINVVKGYSCCITTSEKQQVEQTEKSKNNIVVFISSESLGNEELTLGKILMTGFLGNIKEMETKPSTIIFVNTGVYLTTVNEDTVSILNNLIDNYNVEVLSCGRCLEYFGIVDKLKTGGVTDAYTVAKKMFEADKVIRV